MIIKFNDTITITYEDGSIEKNIAVTGWMVNPLNQNEIILNGKKVVKIEKEEKE